MELEGFKSKSGKTADGERLVEYYPEGEGTRRSLKLRVNSDNNLIIEFIRRRPASNPGVTYTPQFSSSLTGESWSDSISAERTEVIDAEWERVIVEDTATGPPVRFGRVKVTAP